MSDDADFFVSYTSVDAGWAEWIAWTLEKDGGYKTCIQAWDFAPGTHFVLKMHEATARSRHTIAVLTPAYLHANFTGLEWAAALRHDPHGFQRRLVPVMVETCEPEGLLAEIVHIGLVGLDEASAREALLSGVSGQQGARLRTRAPAFPGAGPLERPSASPSFPGVAVNNSQRNHAARSVVTNVGSPPDLPAPEPLPWVPLSASPAVRWNARRVNTVTGAPPASRLELHLIPVSSGASVARPDFGVVRNALVAAGRSNGIFPATATVSVQTAADYIEALLTAPASAAKAGLRVDEDGERSGWLSLPPADTADITSPVTERLSRLLAALINLPPALPERVTFAAAVSGKAKLPPRDWLSSRDLTRHAQQVATELGRQLSAVTTVREPAPGIVNSSGATTLPAPVGVQFTPYLEFVRRNVRRPYPWLRRNTMAASIIATKPGCRVWLSMRSRTQRSPP